MINEEFLNESMNCEAIVTGADVADLLGMRSQYNRGKAEIQHDNEVIKENIKNEFFDMMNRMDNVPK